LANDSPGAKAPGLVQKGVEIMALPDTLPAFTPDEYLAFERSSESKHEYLDGLIYAMVGSSPEHSTICVNVSEVITRQLRGTPCRPFSADMKIHCLSSPSTTRRRRGLFAYPDLIVVCGEPVFHDTQRDVLVNPTLIVEVLSPSTEAYDRGEKFLRYQELTALTDYLLVAQRYPCLEHFAKQANGQWLLTIETHLSSSLCIASINCRLPLAEVYEWVQFPTSEAPVSASNA
jgi:Uma2 family endonuclease